METRNLHLNEVIVCVTTPEVKTIPLFPESLKTLQLSEINFCSFQVMS